MRKLLLSICILIAFTSFSQTLPEIPLKNGYAYYTFTHKLGNTKKCLSSYFITNHEQIQEKIRNLSDKISMEKEKLGNLKQIKSFTINLKNRDNNKAECIDTITYDGNASNFNITIMDDKWGMKPSFVGVKKIGFHALSATISIVFISKNEYKLIIKNIVYTVYWAKLNLGEMKNGEEIYNLGEYYEKIKNQDKLKKVDINFFIAIDKLIKTADDIFLKTITDIYSVDEL